MEVYYSVTTRQFSQWNELFKIKDFIQVFLIETINWILQYSCIKKKHPASLGHNILKVHFKQKVCKGPVASHIADSKKCDSSLQQKFTLNGFLMFL